MNQTAIHSRRDVRKARSVAEIIDLAGPDFAFTVEARPAFFRDPAGAMVEAPQAQVIVRTDTNESLSVVGPAYVPAQVRDFLDPLDELLRDGLVAPVSASTFDGGLHRAIELQLPKPIVLPGPGGSEDVLLRRVLWRDTLDGTARLSFSDSLLRRWCTNGAAHVLGMMGSLFKHTSRRMAEARALSLNGALQESSRRFEVVEANARRLLATPFSPGRMVQVAERLYPADAEGKVSSRALNARDAIVTLFQRGQGNSGATAWDAVNAVTEWSTHHRPVRGAGNTPGLARLKAIWLGDSQAQEGIEAVAEVAGVELLKA